MLKIDPGKPQGAVHPRGNRLLQARPMNRSPPGRFRHRAWVGDRAGLNAYAVLLVYGLVVRFFPEALIPAPQAPSCPRLRLSSRSASCSFSVLRRQSPVWTTSGTSSIPLFVPWPVRRLPWLPCLLRQTRGSSRLLRRTWLPSLDLSSRQERHPPHIDSTHGRCRQYCTVHRRGHTRLPSSTRCHLSAGRRTDRRRGCLCGFPAESPKNRQRREPFRVTNLILG